MNISQPDITLNIAPAQSDVDNTSPRVLFVGQQISGTATTGTLTENIGNDAQEVALYGTQSHLANMIREFRRINPIAEIDAVGYDDNGSGVAATGTLAFSGTATATGTAYVTIGGSKQHRLAITITSGDTATEVGDAVDTAVAADLTIMASSSNTTGTVTVTALNDGTLGNQISLRVEDLPAGITVTVTGMASGATNPVLTGLSALIDDKRYHTIVYPGTYDLSVIDGIMDARFNVTNDILDGVAIVAKTDTYSNLLTYVSTLNQELILAVGNKTVADSDYAGGAILEHDDLISSQIAAIRTLRLIKDANISRYVTGNLGAKDGYGGSHTASLPYFNTPFFDLPLIPTSKGFTRLEIEALQLVGVSVLHNNTAGNTLIAGEFVTTYRTDSAGNADASFKFVNYVDTISQIREYMFNNLKKQYAQCRLTDGPLTPGYNMANDASIRAYLTGLYLDLSGDGFVLTRFGEENLKYYKDNLSVVLDLANGKVTLDMKVPVVVQLRTIIGTVRIAFDVNS